MRSEWKDGDRIREADVTPLGEGRFRVVVDGVAFEMAVEALGAGVLRLISSEGAVQAEVTAVGDRRFVRLGTLEFVLDRATAGPRGRRAGVAGGGLEAPMPGLVTRVMVRAGEAVKRGQPLVALEAMKMEHLIRSPRDGRVRALPVLPGEMVNGGVALVELEAE